MPRFSKRSEQALQTCHPNLRRVLRMAIQFFDFSVVEGERDEDTQNRYFLEGKTKLKYPKSRHNRKPSLAVDVVPYVNGAQQWEDEILFAQLSGCILTCARQLGVKVRWGGDWDRDGLTRDERFSDMPHYELEDA